MSFNVLIIPEDFTKDEHILKPFIEEVLREAGRPKAVVRVCRDPNFQGISECLKVERLRNEVVRRYPMVNLFLLIVDADGKAGRADALDHVVSQMKGDLDGRTFFAEMARQEVEILLLAGHVLSPGWSWGDIRSDPDVKNTYFRELVKREGTENQPHQGRKVLMRTAMRNWSRIKSRCVEETTGLASRIRDSF